MFTKQFFYTESGIGSDLEYNHLMGRKMLFKNSGLLFLVSLFLSFANLAIAKYQFGVQITELSPDATFAMQKQGFDYFSQILGRQLQDEITVITFNDRKALIKALNDRTIDLAYMDVVALALANDKKFNIQKLLTVTTWNKETLQPTVSYSSYIFANMKKDNIATFYDLQGTRFGFVKNSASGFFYPVNFLKSYGIDYRTYFRESDFYDIHYALYNALIADQIDAAATSEADFNMNKFTGDFKVITVIPGIPNPLIAVNGSIPINEIEKIKQALLNLPQVGFTGLTFMGVTETPPQFYNAAIEIIQKNLASQWE